MKTESDKNTSRVRSLRSAPTRTCRTLLECVLCGKDITLGQIYRDRGYGRPAHVECIPPEVELSKEQRICYERGYHEDKEFIDPQSGGFTRCQTCGRDVDREESEEW